MRLLEKFNISSAITASVISAILGIIALTLLVSDTFMDYFNEKNAGYLYIPLDEKIYWHQINEDPNENTKFLFKKTTPNKQKGGILLIKNNSNKPIKTKMVGKMPNSSKMVKEILVNDISSGDGIFPTGGIAGELNTSHIKINHLNLEGETELPLFISTDCKATIMDSDFSITYHHNTSLKKFVIFSDWQIKLYITLSLITFVSALCGAYRFLKHKAYLETHIA